MSVQCLLVYFFHEKYKQHMVNVSIFLHTIISNIKVICCTFLFELKDEFNLPKISCHNKLWFDSTDNDKILPNLSIYSISDLIDHSKKPSGYVWTFMQGILENIYIMNFRNNVPCTEEWDLIWFHIQWISLFCTNSGPHFIFKERSTIKIPDT